MDAQKIINAVYAANIAAGVHLEYARKISVGAELDLDAYRRGGLEAVREELAELRRLDACPIVIGELERRYRRRQLRELPPERLALSFGAC
jgi:hypothetical protein